MTETSLEGLISSSHGSQSNTVILSRQHEQTRGSMKELEVLKKKKKNDMVEDELGSHNVISESQG